jgi:hypothetical protein
MDPHLLIMNIEKYNIKMIMKQLKLIKKSHKIIGENYQYQIYYYNLILICYHNFLFIIITNKKLNGLGLLL